MEIVLAIAVGVAIATEYLSTYAFNPNNTLTWDEDTGAWDDDNTTWD